MPGSYRLAQLELYLARVENDFIPGEVENLKTRAHEQAMPLGVGSVALRPMPPHAVALDPEARRRNVEVEEERLARDLHPEVRDEVCFDAPEDSEHPGLEFGPDRGVSVVSTSQQLPQCGYAFPAPLFLSDHFPQAVEGGEPPTKGVVECLPGDGRRFGGGQIE